MDVQRQRDWDTLILQQLREPLRPLPAWCPMTFTVVWVCPPQLVCKSGSLSHSRCSASFALSLETSVDLCFLPILFLCFVLFPTEF